MTVSKHVLLWGWIQHGCSCLCWPLPYPPLTASTPCKLFICNMFRNRNPACRLSQEDNSTLHVEALWLLHSYPRLLNWGCSLSCKEMLYLFQNSIEILWLLSIFPRNTVAVPYPIQKCCDCSLSYIEMMFLFLNLSRNNVVVHYLS